MTYAVEEWQDNLLSAGQVASAGHYLRVDVEAARVVELSDGDILPASLDGRVAMYVRLEDLGWVDLGLSLRLS